MVKFREYLVNYCEYFLELPIEKVTGYWVYPNKVLRAFVFLCSPLASCFGS